MLKILVPTDYSSCSIAALKHAASLAHGSDDTMLILHVVESGSPLELPDSSKEQDPLRQDVALLLRSFSECKPPLRFEERRMEGFPVSAILSTAAEEHVDMIVMGTSGRTGLKRLLLGSVAEEVTRRSPCPVLTLKAQHNEKNGEAMAEINDNRAQPVGIRGVAS